MNNNQPVTKKHLDESLDKVQKTILDGVGEIVGSLVNHMDERFDEVDERFERLERKVDTVTDDHSVRIAKLEKSPA